MCEYRVRTYTRGVWLVRGCKLPNVPGDNLCSLHRDLLSGKSPVRCPSAAPVLRSEPETDGAEAAATAYEQALPVCPVPSKEATKEGICWLLGISYEVPEWQRTTSF